MTKRQQKAQARREEEHAVRLYQQGKTLREITKRTTVPGWVVRGLVCAATISTGGKNA